ncbi:putative alpha-L-fucosidase [Condylostylus longicornis]|uniref:putative alpha-L-fucosidase n=1 Tax=Condylostylus longicornis TaxID=2530218 RepID=UPI00244E5732|nr:putative alpha-L-fucosidase [Condylostylus longicornis]
MSLNSVSILILFFIYINVIFRKNVNCIKDNEIHIKYQPKWESLDKRPLPHWYSDAKIGIIIHWGIYSVPSLGGEWFWIYLKENRTDHIEFMEKNYKPNFSYQDFAKDFTAESFNATEWSLLFQQSGAKYVVLTSKHHDGYTLWPSSRAFNWNSVDIGPNLDIIGELSAAIRKNTKLKFGVYYSLFEWFNRMYINDKILLFGQKNYVKTKVLPELHELIDHYKPEILWSDGDWEAFPDYWNSEEFLAWLYNDSPVKDTVVTNDRWGIGTHCKHGDFYTCEDRYNPGILQTHKWENAFTLDKNSWGERTVSNLDDYMTSEEIIKEIVTTISCNGNVLINVGPTKYGTIKPIFQERLRDMGSWLKINGEAIYSSKFWIYQNDTLSSNVWYTMKQYPKSDNRTIIYAMILNYPFDTNSIELGALHNKIDDNTMIKVLGLPDDFELEWEILEKSLLVKFPPKSFLDKNQLKYAYTLKIDIPKY